MGLRSGPCNEGQGPGCRSELQMEFCSWEGDLGTGVCSWTPGGVLCQGLGLRAMECWSEAIQSVLRNFSLSPLCCWQVTMDKG